VKILLALVLGLVSFVTSAQEAASGSAQNDAKTARPERIRIGGAVAAAKLLHRVQPTYPPLARQTRISGTVRLDAIIGKDGTVKQLTVISGHPLLVEAALDAVRQWEYQATELNGEPIAIETTIDVIFALQDQPTGGTSPTAADLPHGTKEAKILRSEDRTIDPVLRADVLKLLEVTKEEENAARAMKQFLDSFRPMMFRSVTDEALRERLFDSYQQKLEGVLQSDVYREGIIAAYAKYFDDNDVRAMIAFYQTPTGQKFNESMPKFLSDIMELGQRAAQERMPGILKELCAENPDVAIHLPDCHPRDDNKSRLIMPGAPRSTTGE